jgi:ketopantoate reductase
VKIAVVGAGALGSVYGARLAHAAQVVFVVRDLDRAPRLIHIDRVGGAPPHGDSLDAPAASLNIPEGSDAVLVTVRVDQLDDALLDKLGSESGDAIVVVLAPLLPHHYERAKNKLGARLVAAMPGVIAYEPDPEATPHERRVRYWTPKSSPTLLEDRGPRVHALVEALTRVGLPAHISAVVSKVNAATTIAFFPILTGIAAAGGSIDRMINDDAIMKLGFAAAKETRALAKTIGDLPPWASLFFKFASPFTARAGIKLGKSRAPEVFVFLEKHFGTKLAAQNLAIFREVSALAAERGVSLPNLEKLVARAVAT